MAKPLTDSVVSNLKPRRGQSGWREVADRASRGLCLRVSPTGEKVWALRHMVGGERTRHTIGAYPTVTLAIARKRASEYLSAARDGLSAGEVDAKLRALRMTVIEAHAEYLKTVGVGLRASTLGLKRQLFHVSHFPRNRDEAHSNHSARGGGPDRRRQLPQRAFGSRPTGSSQS